MFIQSRLSSSVAAKASRPPSTTTRYSPYPKTKPAAAISSSLSSVPSTLARGHSSSLQSLMSPREDQDEAVAAAGKARRALTQTIDEVFPQLRGYCPIHFAIEQTLQSCGDRCDLIKMSNFQAFRNAFVFERYTYCYRCGVPNDKPRLHYFAPSFHQVEWYQGKVDCPYIHFLFKTIYALWFREDLKPAFCRDLGIQATSEKEFTEWAILTPLGLTETTYFNGMTLMLWYCKHVGLVEDS